MQKNKRTLLWGGGLIGAVNGLLGGGGGMIAVPLLSRAGYATPCAHATAIAVILPASLFSGIVYLIRGFTPPALLVPVAVGATVGGFFGAKLLKILPERMTEILFAVLMLSAGLKMFL